jgi:hypothetical protein
MRKAVGDIAEDAFGRKVRELRPRSDLWLEPACSKAPLMLLLQFLNTPPRGAEMCLVTDVGKRAALLVGAQVRQDLYCDPSGHLHPRTRDRSIVEQVADHLAKRLMFWSSIAFAQKVAKLNWRELAAGRRVRVVENKHMVLFTT